MINNQTPYPTGSYEEECYTRITNRNPSLTEEEVREWVNNKPEVIALKALNSLTPKEFLNYLQECLGLNNEEFTTYLEKEVEKYFQTESIT